MRAMPAILAALACAASGAFAQNANIPMPIEEVERKLAYEAFTVDSADEARSQIKNDPALKANVTFADGTKMQVKIRRAMPGASAFNNEPRYEQAAYELQKLFLDPKDYVVPPTAIRGVPIEVMKKFQPDVQRTFSRSDDVVVVMQYWLQEVIQPKSIYDPDLFDRDETYARRFGNVNTLTFLIDHKDSNAGNLLVSKHVSDLHLYAIDNGVAFDSLESDRGTFWRKMHAKKLSASMADRLKKLTRADLERELAVVWELGVKDGHFVTVESKKAGATSRGIRLMKDTYQFGLTRDEITGVQRRMQVLVRDLNGGRIQTF